VLYAVKEGTLHGGLGGRRGIRLHLLEGRVRVVPYRLGDAQKTRVITISARKGVAIHKTGQIRFLACLAEADLAYREKTCQITNLKNGDIEIVWEQEGFAVVKSKADLAAARSCS